MSSIAVSSRMRVLPPLRSRVIRVCGASDSTIRFALGMSSSDAEAYVRATDPGLEPQTFASEPGVLLAPDLDAIVTRATQLYAQVGDAAAKQLTVPKTATPTPTPTPTPTATPKASPRP